MMADSALQEKAHASEAGKAEAPDQGWAADWDDGKLSSQAGSIKESKLEQPAQFSPVQSRNLDEFLQSTSVTEAQREKEARKEWQVGAFLSNEGHEVHCFLCHLESSLQGSFPLV